ncbi:MAG: hypothetical protein DRI77_10780, partial [Chloroflexi bacterium]
AAVHLDVSDGGSGVAAAWYCSGSMMCVPSIALPGDGVVTVQGQSETSVYLRVMAMDALGNTVTRTVYTLRYDNVPPRLVMGDLPDTTCSSSFTVTAMVSDVVISEAYVALLRDGVEVDRCTDLNACELTFEDEGEYTVRLVATDEAGNTVHLDSCVVYDVSAPIVDLSAPERVSVAAGSFDAVWAVDAGASWRFLVDGSEKQQGDDAAGDAKVFFAPVTGTIVLRVEAWDTVGNNGYDEDVVQIVTDYDADGMPDLWEAAHGLDWQSAADAEGDNDNDGLTNAEECQTNTDPQDPDSDNDGLSDGDEVHTYDTDPTNPDSDGDGLDDGWEVQHGTDPLAPTSVTDQAALEISPGEQTVSAGKIVHFSVSLRNLGQTEISTQVAAGFPGGYSPDGYDAGWVVGSGNASRLVSVPAGESKTYDLPLVYGSPGENDVTVSVLTATSTATVHVIDSSWLSLESVEHPAQVHPEEQAAVQSRMRNVSDTPAPAVALRVALGNEEHSYLRDMTARELWEQETTFTVPGWSAFPNADTASLPVEVEGAQGYSGQIVVVGPRFDIHGDVEQGIGVVTYTLKVTNNGNRVGLFVAQLSWSAGAAPVVVSRGDAWIQDNALIWQVEDVSVGESCYATVVVTVMDGDLHQVAVETEPGWSLGTIDVPDALAVGRQIIYLPLVLRGYER